LKIPFLLEDYMNRIDLSPVRKYFPALNNLYNGKKRIFLDGAGGTQVPQQVIDAMVDYLINKNANYGGYFETSIITDEILVEVRKRMSDFINAPSWKEILLGPNMTTLTFNLVWSLSKQIKPGDEILLDRTAHGGNIDAWHCLEEYGAVIKYIEFKSGDCTLDYEMAQKMVSDKTKIITVGLASNATGTIHDVKRLAALAHKYNAMIFVDAVHAAPHIPIDVVALDIDFLACSAYKFFGPHVGFIWGKAKHLESIDPHRPWAKISTEIPSKYILGTPNMEGFAGTIAALEYLEMLGRDFGAKYAGSFPGFTGRRLELKKSMAAIAEYEIELGLLLNEGLKKKKGLKVFGITNPEDFVYRCPTFSFTLEGKTPADICRKMNDNQIFVWNGEEGFGAYELVKSMDLIKGGGLLRVSIEHYNTKDEISRFLEVLYSL
jgi:cysteine desulfurase family protein (TIGR01976 family)